MWWTTEQVAEHAGMTVEQVYESRRRKEWPGIVGVRQGRSLRFDPDRVTAGPQEPQRTDDPAVAAVWIVEDIRGMVRQIRTAVDELLAWTRQQQMFEATLGETSTAVADWAEGLDDERADDDDRRAESPGEGSDDE